jgi:hypothetical protein
MVTDNSQENGSNEMIADRVRLHFAQEALASIIVNRNEQNGYSIRVVSKDECLSPRLTEADVITLLPAGSRWLPAVGWHSYFGIPFRFDNKIWLAAGAEVVNRHQARGAYVSFFAFIFPFHQPPIRQLAELAIELGATLPEQVPVRPANSQRLFFEHALKFMADGFSRLDLLGHSYKVVESSSRTPAEHTKVEAEIIREAAESYSKRELLLFRTLILSENQLERHQSLFSGCQKKKTFAKLQIRYCKYLAATVPTIKSTFKRGNSSGKVNL